MKITANSIRAGNILVHEDALWIVSKNPEHTKPGKGGAYVQVEMKNLKTHTKLNIRFSSSDYVEKAELEQKVLQFLYADGENLIFMDSNNGEQIFVRKQELGDKLALLEDNMSVSIQFYNEMPISVDLPHTVIVEISETDPIIKGSTVTSSYKPAILTNGLKVMVPPYLVAGEKVVIKTEDLSFVERAK